MTEVEKGQIMAYKETGLSNVAIGKKIGRSEKVIRNFLKNLDGYGKYANTGPQPKLNARDQRRVVAEASKNMSRASQIIHSCGLKVSRQTIYRALSQSGVIERQRMKSAPKLLDRHKTTRREFARKNMATDGTRVSNPFTTKTEV